MAKRKANKKKSTSRKARSSNKKKAPKKAAKAVVTDLDDDDLDELEDELEDESYGVDNDESVDLLDTKDDEEDEMSLEDEIEGGLNEQEALDAPSAELPEDVFETAWRKTSKKGDGVRFVIHRFNQILCVKDYPYSLDDLMKEWGGGSYHVYAKSIATGQLITHKAFTVSGAPKMQASAASSHDEEDYEDREPTITPQSSGPEPMNMREMVALLAEMRHSSQAETNVAAQSQNNAMASMMTMVTTMMNSQSKMQMESAQRQAEQQAQQVQFQMQMMKEMQESTNRQIQALAERDKKPEFGMMDVLKLMEKSEEKAIRNQEKIQKMLDAREDKQSDMLEELAALKSENKPSASERILEALVPVIAGAAAQSMDPKPSANALPSPQVLRRPPHPAAPRTRPAPVGASINPINNSSGNGASVRPNGNGSGNGKPLQQPIQHTRRISLKDKVQSVLSSLVLRAIFTSTPEKAARQAEALLAKEQIPKDVALQHFSLDELLGYAVKYNLPQAKQEWIKQFYASVQGQPQTIETTGKRLSAEAGAPSAQAPASGPALQAQRGTQGESSNH